MQMIEDFCCSVCYDTQDIMKVTTTCGHQLCLTCTAKLHKRECPMCRTPFPTNTVIPKDNDYCNECKSPLSPNLKCCENSKCTLCLLNALDNEAQLQLIVEQFHIDKCNVCYKKYPEDVKKILQNKKDSLIQMRNKITMLSTGLQNICNIPNKLPYSVYSTAYTDNSFLRSHFND